MQFPASQQWAAGSRNSSGSDLDCRGTGCGCSSGTLRGVQGLPGYVWLDMPGKVRSVGMHELEFTTGPERP
jgi:hypothetical protein